MARCTPKGPARAEFWSLATQTPEAPPTEPEQVMPAGIWMATGKSMVWAAERPPMPIPGTFWVTVAVLKALGSVPATPATTGASMVTCDATMVLAPFSDWRAGIGTTV